MKKHRASPHQATDDFGEPRIARGFVAKHYPKSDGSAAPPVDSTDRHDRIRLKFLATYYHLNQAYARLLEVRKQPNRKSARGQSAELAALRHVERILRQRDALEDELAPYGVIAEPIVENGFTVDVKFSFGSRPPGPSGPFYSSAFITIPLPPGVKLE